MFKCIGLHCFIFILLPEQRENGFKILGNYVDTKCCYFLLCYDMAWGSRSRSWNLVFVTEISRKYTCYLAYYYYLNWCHLCTNNVRNWELEDYRIKPEYLKCDEHEQKAIFKWSIHNRLNYYDCWEHYSRLWYDQSVLVVDSCWC